MTTTANQNYANDFISSKKEGDRLTIYIKGTLNSAVRDQFRNAYHDEPLYREYILEFKGAEFIDSSGLGMLIALYGRTKAHDHDIRLLITGCSAALKQILEMSKLENFFEIK